MEHCRALDSTFNADLVFFIKVVQSWTQTGHLQLTIWLSSYCCYLLLFLILHCIGFNLYWHRIGYFVMTVPLRIYPLTHPLTAVDSEFDLTVMDMDSSDDGLITSLDQCFELR